MPVQRFVYRFRKAINKFLRDGSVNLLTLTEDEPIAESYGDVTVFVEDGTLKVVDAAGEERVIEDFAA